jgi:transcriptional regulator
MYIPAHFKEDRPEELHRLIREHPFGLLVNVQAGELNGNHLPFELDTSGTLTLRAHVARANPVWRDFDPSVEVLVVFQGAQTYITPSWYETKRETGKVVPTYNYLVVHAVGPLRIVDDRAWLRGLVERLTGRFESRRADPWAVSDAPDEYIDKLLEAIVGLEIPVRRLDGKWKASQNRPAADQLGVAEGLLRETGDDAHAMAAAVDAVRKS